MVIFGINSIKEPFDTLKSFIDTWHLWGYFTDCHYHQNLDLRIDPIALYTLR